MDKTLVLDGGRVLFVSPPGICLVVICAALYSDVKLHIIPNMLTIPAILAGQGFNFISQGEGGLIFAFNGFAAGMGILIVPFLLGGIGGGDVKLLAALGAWLGADAIFNIFLYGAISGGLIALFFMAFSSPGLKGIKGIWDDVKLFLLIGRPLHLRTTRSFPYTVPIFIGFVLYLVYGSIV